MSRLSTLILTGCVFLATLWLSCIFVDENCDYIETRCWDVVDVYCDAWGCWEEYSTECVDYCVNAAAPLPAPECSSDRHCPANHTCSNRLCVPSSDPPGSAGLCEACQSNSDCAQSGALCLNLTPEAETGFCGQTCQSDLNCPTGFECIAISGEDIHQCIPISQQGVRSCSQPNPTPVECFDDEDCESPEICEDSLCIIPETPPECTSNQQCDPHHECTDGSCVFVPDCQNAEECEDGEDCLDGICTLVEERCSRNSDCLGDGICIDGRCYATCERNDDCSGELVCQAGLCTSPPEPECSTGSDCGEENEYYCVNGSCREACSQPEDCVFGYYCRVFYCDIDPAVECRSRLECAHDEQCIDGECLPIGD